MERCNAFHAKVYWTQAKNVMNSVTVIQTKSEHVDQMKLVFFMLGRNLPQKHVRSMIYLVCIICIVIIDIRKHEITIES